MPTAHDLGRRVAIASVLASGLLAVIKILVGWLAGSTAVVADGVESAADVVASTIVFFGLSVAARPADEDHPYGHGRFETLTGLGVGLLLTATGIVITLASFRKLHMADAPPAAFAMWPLALSILVKSCMSAVKFHYGRRIRSEALTADAWNDTVDILSGTVALAAVGLTLYDPKRFLPADEIGGMGVGLIVILLGLRVIWDTSLQLMDTMPDEATMERIRQVALQEPGALGVEKCFARKTGLQYHVDLHLEVDPQLTVELSHEIATRVRIRLKEELDWVADVLVHVEPWQGIPTVRKP